MNNSIKCLKIVGNQDLIVSKKNLETADLNLIRLSELNQKGLRSDRDLELAKLDKIKASSDFMSKEASLQVAQEDLLIFPGIAKMFPRT